MTVSLTYDSTLSRVQIAIDGLGDALTATVERSQNQVTWATVRGGSAVTVTSGACSLDDYEFSADVQNFYRVTYDDTLQFVSVGADDTDNNASVTPGLPAGHAEDDALLLFASIRNSGTGTVDAPAGYSSVLETGNVRLLSKVDGGSESAPTVTFTGGAAGADTGAQLLALRGADPDTAQVATQLNSSAQNIEVPALTLTDTWHGGAVLYLGWKQDDWTSVALATGTEADEFTSTTGSDMGMVWNWRILDPDVEFSDLSTVTFTVTGGSSAISRGAVAAFQPRRITQQASITPTLTAVWIKVIPRPFLNTQVDAYGEVNVTRRARNAVFPVIGRSAPVGVTDLRAGREFPLQVMTLTAESHRRLDFLLAGGDAVFIHAPAGSPVPSMYAVIGDTTDDQPVPGTHLWVLPLTEVAAPAAEIVGETVTYQGVLNAYSTYQDVIDAEDDYASILTLIGDPSDVIVD